MIAVDSSSWIAFLSPGEAPGDDTALVESALAEQQACLPPVVLTELLSDPKLPAAVASLLAQLPVLLPDSGYWRRAGELRANVVSRKQRNLISVSMDGKKVTEVLKDSPFLFPNDVVVDGQGNYLVSDGYAKTIWKVSPQGIATVLVKGEPFKNPVGIALEKSGSLLVADPHAKAVFRVSPEGKVTTLLKDS